MSFIAFRDLPPWDWPPNAARMILEVLGDDKADGSEGLLAVELAGDSAVIGDELAEALLSIIGDVRAPDELRGCAAIALGPALEYKFIDEFEGPDEVPITEPKSNWVQKALDRHYLAESAPQIACGGGRWKRRCVRPGTGIKMPCGRHTPAMRTPGN